MRVYLENQLRGCLTPRNGNKTEATEREHHLPVRLYSYSLAAPLISDNGEHWLVS